MTTTTSIAAPRKATPVADKPAQPAAPKTAAKTVAKATKVVTKVPPISKPMPTAKPAKKAAASKDVKVKKPKMVRDSFTMPKAEFAVLDVLKLRATKAAYPVKKTELIRAGIKALAAMPDTAFLAAIKAVPNLKTGRPIKSKAD